MKSLFVSFFAILFSSALFAESSDSIVAPYMQGVEIISTRISATQASAPFQVMTAETMSKMGILEVSDAVRHFTGVSVKDYGGLGGIKTVSVRGFGAQHTTVTYDGIAINDVQAGMIDIGRFSLKNISSISLSLGPNDIFQPARNFSSLAVLDLNTRSLLSAQKKRGGEVGISTGSFGFFNPYLTYTEKLSRRFTLSADANWQRADGMYPFYLANGVDSGTKKRKNSDVDIFRTEANLYGSFSDKDELKVKVYYFDSERGIPGSVILYNDYSVERMKNNNFFSQISYKYDISKLVSYKVLIKYDYAFMQYNDNDIFNDEVTRFEQNEYYLSNIIRYRPNDKFSVALAQDLTYDKLRNDSVMIAVLRNPSRKSSLTNLAAEYESSRFSVIGNLYATYSQDEVLEGGKSTYKHLSPSVSASYALLESKSLRMRFAYRDIFRIPTITEEYYKRVGSKLKPEKVRQFNLGFIWSTHVSDVFDYFRLSVDAYHANVKDKIIIIPGTSFSSTANKGKVRMNGVDVDLKAKVMLSEQMNLDLMGGYSFLSAEDISDPAAKNYKDQIPYTPKHSGSGALMFNNPIINLGYSFVASGERYMQAQNISDNHMARYSDHTFSANKQFNIGHTLLSLQADLRNAFRANYDIVRYYPMPGRSFTVSASLKF